MKMLLVMCSSIRDTLREEHFYILYYYVSFAHAMLHLQQICKNTSCITCTYWGHYSL